MGIFSDGEFFKILIVTILHLVAEPLRFSRAGRGNDMTFSSMITMLSQVFLSSVHIFAMNSRKCDARCWLPLVFFFSSSTTPSGTSTGSAVAHP